jgi:hypothetical protein
VIFCLDEFGPLNLAAYDLRRDRLYGQVKKRKIAPISKSSAISGRLATISSAYPDAQR